MSSTGARRPRRFGALAKNAAPYVIAAVALGWVLHRTKLASLTPEGQLARRALADALIHVNKPLFVLLSATMLVLNCAADTFAMTAVFARFGCRVRYRDLYLVRASTYLAAVINYHIGQALIIGYLVRVQRVPLLRASGWILFIIGINVGTLFLLASAGAANASGDLQILHVIPVVCAISIGIYALLLWLKPPLLAERTLLKPLFEMGIPGHIYGVIVRLPHIGVLLVWHFLVLHMFGVQVPLGAAFLYLPAYFAVGSLPINVNGIGVAQGVALAFFSRYVDAHGAPDPHAVQQATVIAYSLATSVISIALQILLGVVCLRRATTLGVKPDIIESGDDAVKQAV
jgi:hypothetical protein